MPRACICCHSPLSNVLGLLSTCLGTYMFPISFRSPQITILFNFFLLKPKTQPKVTLSTQTLSECSVVSLSWLCSLANNINATGSVTILSPQFLTVVFAGSVSNTLSMRMSAIICTVAGCNLPYLVLLAVTTLRAAFTFTAVNSMGDIGAG